MDDDTIARYIDRGKEREAHDVVPMQVGHENMVGLRRTGRELPQIVNPQGPSTRTEIQEHMTCSLRLQLHATGVTTIRASDFKRQLGVNKRLHVLPSIQALIYRRIERCHHFRASLLSGQRDRNRPPGTPKTDFHGKAFLI